MSIQAGLVGLPNVGKSTLFNALTKSSIPAENYPFCTIDPHIAITEVPDPRVGKLQHMYNSQRTIPAQVTFVDIAGLVKGAASGEGLGNQFLSHIRTVDLILHVLRCFEDPNITYTGSAEEIDPIGDYEIIVAELMLKDLESVVKRQEKVQKLIKASQSKPKERAELEAEQKILTRIHQALDNGDHQKVRDIAIESGINTLSLLSAKNFVIIANIDEHEIENDAYLQNKYYQSLVNKFGAERVIPISAKIEYELSQLSTQEAEEMMGMIGLKQRSLDTIIKKSYENLGLITFFTCGPQEIHSWPIKKGIPVRQAAGEIHSDLERGFICAEVFNYTDLLEFGTEAKLKEVGKIRREGQDYIVQDGDIIHVRFNV